MKFKYLLVILACLIGVLPVSAQPFDSFGILTTNFQSKPAVMRVGGPLSSYSVQYSANGTNSYGPAAVVTAGTIWVISDQTKVGYYRLLTHSNSVVGNVTNQIPYYSTNTYLYFWITPSVVGGNRQINVAGPTNLTYNILGSTNLTNWSTNFTGVVGQTNFVDPGLATRFYKAKPQ